MARGREVAQQKRLNILDDHEIDDLYGLPRFTSDERQLYFTLTGAEQAVCHRLRSLPSQVSSILQLGYFKARQQFFTFTFAQVADDVAAVLARHVPAESPVSLVTPTAPTLANQRDIILELFGYRMCRGAERQQRELAGDREQRPSPVSKTGAFQQYILEARVEAAALVGGQPILSNLVRHRDSRLDGVVLERGVFPIGRRP